MIALSNISKTDKSHQLQKLIYFFTRTNVHNKDRILQILKLKYLELLIQNNENSVGLEKFSKFIDTKGVVFSTYYKEYLKELDKTNFRGEYKKTLKISEEEISEDEAEFDESSTTTVNK